MRKEVKAKRDLKTIGRRCSEIYGSQKRRAAKKGIKLTYDRNDLLQVVKIAICREGWCPYCKEELTAINFSMDHEIPIAHGGTFTLSNQVVACKRCNSAKGTLNKSDFLALLRFLATLSPDSQTEILRRLQAGTKVWFRK